MLRLLCGFLLLIMAVAHAQAKPVSIKVWSDKIAYSPEEKGSAEVTLKNNTSSSLYLDIITEMRREVDDSKILDQRKISLPQRGSKGFKINFSLTSYEFGHEVRVRALKKGETLAEGSGVFVVADNFFKVSTVTEGSGFGNVGVDPDKHTWNSHYQSENYLRAVVRELRERHITMVEEGFWAPSDWGGLTPKSETWFSGQGGKPVNGKNLKRLIEICHENGIKVIAYVNNTACGPAGAELARKHPEWFHGEPFFLQERSGSSASFSFWPLEYWNDIPMKVKYGKVMEWPIAKPRLEKKAVLDFGIENLLESIDQFKWDGIRYDSVQWAVRESIPLSIFNAQEIKRHVWAKYPRFRFGVNYGFSPSSPECHYYKYAWHFKDSEQEVREKIAGGGLYMQEAINVNKHGPGKAAYTGWREMADGEGKAAEMLRRMGGTYQALLGTGFEMNQAPFFLTYKRAVLDSAGCHLFENTSGERNKHLLRYSSLIWDLQMRSIPPSKLSLEVDGPKNLYWKNRVYTRLVNAQERQVIVHLLNLPIKDSFAEFNKKPDVAKPDIDETQDNEDDFDLDLEGSVESKDKADPLALFNPPLKNVSISFTIPKGEKLDGVFSLDMYHKTSPRKLELISTNPLRVSIDTLPLWTSIIIKLKGEYKMPKTPPKFTETVAPEIVSKERQRLENHVRREIIEVGKSRIYPREQPTIKSLSNTAMELAKKASTKISGQRQPMQNGLKNLLVLGGYYYPLYRFAEVAKAIDPKAEYSEMQPNISEQKVLNRQYREMRPDHASLTEGQNEEGDEFGDILDSIEKEVSAMKRGQKRQARKHLKVTLTPFPARDLTVDLINEQDAIVISNVPKEALNNNVQKALYQFVHAGGHLVLLGGGRSFGSGRYRETYIECLSPVDMSNGYDIVKLSSPKELQHEDSRLGNIHYIHKTRLRQGSQLQQALTTSKHGKLPLVVSRKTGKGTTTAYLATPWGGTDEKQIAKSAWSHPDWPSFLAKLIRRSLGF